MRTRVTSAALRTIPIARRTQGRASGRYWYYMARNDPWCAPHDEQIDPGAPLRAPNDARHFTAGPAANACRRHPPRR
jgi:hypothetical protein